MIGLAINQTCRKEQFLMAKEAIDLQGDQLSQPVAEEPKELSSEPSNSLSLVRWIMGSPQDFADEFVKGSQGLSDKVDAWHNFHKMYQPQLSRLIRNKVANSHTPVEIRMLEIGLGCAPGGGMINGKPGGSAFAWRHLFNLIPNNIVKLELHVFEFDENCAKKWAEENVPTIANGVHVGDASSEEDLERAFVESGGLPFDVIIDDGSHIK